MKHVLIIQEAQFHPPPPLLLGVYEHSTVRLMDVICQGGTPSTPQAEEKKTHVLQSEPIGGTPPSPPVPACGLRIDQCIRH